MELENNNLGPNERLQKRVNLIRNIRDKILTSDLTIEEETMILNAILEEVNNIAITYQRNLNIGNMLESDNISHDYHEVEMETSDMKIEGDLFLREPNIKNIKRLENLILKIRTLENLSDSEKRLLEDVMERYKMDMKELLGKKNLAREELQSIFASSSDSKKIG